MGGRIRGGEKKGTVEVGFCNTKKQDRATHHVCEIEHVAPSGRHWQQNCGDATETVLADRSVERPAATATRFHALWVQNRA